jgi:hypothetical protein
MNTKEDIIRYADSKLVWCSQFIDDGKALNQIQKIQNDLQYYSNRQLGELLDALEEFNIEKPEAFQIVIEVTDNIKKSIL